MLTGLTLESSLQLLAFSIGNFCEFREKVAFGLTQGAERGPEIIH